jgi:hypothetical protein
MARLPPYKKYIMRSRRRGNEMKILLEIPEWILWLITLCMWLYILNKVLDFIVWFKKRKLDKLKKGANQ